MGGSAQMLLAKGEATKVRKWLNTMAVKSTKGEYYAIGTRMPDRDYDSWIHPELKGRKLTIDYSFGGPGSSLCDALAAELCKKFKVERFGWDSIGWCKPDYDPTKLKPYALEIKMYGRYSKTVAKSLNKILQMILDFKSDRKYLMKWAKQVVANTAKPGKEKGQWLVNADF